MHAFELPRRYKTIYICDSFGLAGGRENDLETLRRCYHHLALGGALVFNIQAEYTDTDSWHIWTTESRNRLPETWPEEASKRTAADDSQSLAFFRTLEVDPLEQRYTRQVRLEKWVAGEKVATEEYTLKGNMYLKNEVILMLNMAGFNDISVTGDYTSEPATPDHGEIIFKAVKQRDHE